MPSALETLVKILKLEREQGCKNTAVIGGLAAFSENWSQNAHSQARKPEIHLLVDELTGLLRQYDTIESKADRGARIGYMLDRITGRVPAPPEFQAPAAPLPPPAEPVAESRAAPPEAVAQPQQDQNQRPPPREEPHNHRPRREERHQHEAPKAEKPQLEQSAGELPPEQQPRHERPDRPKQHQQQNQPKRGQNQNQRR